MRKVWLSTTYYMDPKIEGLSPNGERLFLRSLALSGNLESDGVLTQKQLRSLSISNLNRALPDPECVGEVHR